MTFTVSHNQLSKALDIALKADIVPFITSSPAMGKSSLVRKIAEDNNLELIDLRLAQLQQFDLAGLVNPNKEEGNFSYLPLDEFPLENTPLPKGKQGFMIFLDEFNSADKYTAAAAYKLLLDRMIGKHKLHPNTRIVCAGNKLTDGAITHKLGTAIQSRVTHLELEINLKEWLEWCEKESNFHPIIHPFLSFRPELINNFNPKKEVITYSSPRTWEMLSKQLKAGLLSLDRDDYVPIIMGTIGEHAGGEFIAFLEVFSKLPNISDIEANPLGCSMPEEIGAKWALGIHLADKINQANEQAIVDYLERMGESDIKVVVYRTLSKVYPNIKLNPTLQKSMKALRNQMVQP